MTFETSFIILIMLFLAQHSWSYIDSIYKKAGTIKDVQITPNGQWRLVGVKSELIGNLINWYLFKYLLCRFYLLKN